MSVQTVAVQLDVPKEGKELVDAVDGLVGHFLSGKPLAELGEQLPAAIAAADGANKVGEELRSQYRDELTAYLVKKLFVRLFGEGGEDVPAPVASEESSDPKPAPV